MEIEQLNAVLWQQRELLEELHYVIDIEAIVFAHGDQRWRDRVQAQVTSVADQLRQAEILRAIHTDAVADSVGLQAAPSLIQLAGEVDEPWRSILLEQRSALQRAICELEATPRTPSNDLNDLNDLRAATAGGAVHVDAEPPPRDT